MGSVAGLTAEIILLVILNLVQDLVVSYLT
jgi:hypothetical protein